jgi:hypothetical protein
MGSTEGEHAQWRRQMLGTQCRKQNAGPRRSPEGGKTCACSGHSRCLRSMGLRSAAASGRESARRGEFDEYGRRRCEDFVF